MDALSHEAFKEHGNWTKGWNGSDRFTLQNETQHFFNKTLLHRTSTAIELRPITSAPDQPSSSWTDFVEVADQIHLVMLVVTTILGLPGNLLVFVTLLKVHTTPGTFYLAVLAVSDFLALVIKALTVAINKYKLITRLDKAHDWFYNTSHFVAVLSNWILILICVERIVCFKLPLKMNLIYTSKFVRLSTGLCVLTVVVVYMSVSWFTSYASDVWIWVFIVTYFFIPFLFVVTAVGIAVYELRKKATKRNSMLSSDQAKRLAKSDGNITVLMLAAALAFLVLTLPLCVIMMIYEGFHFSQKSLELFHSEAFYLSERISISLSHMNHAINVYLYFISGRRFREQVCQLLGCCRH